MPHDYNRQQFECDSPHPQRCLEQDKNQQGGGQGTYTPRWSGFPGEKIDPEHEQYQHTSQIAVDHFFPGFAGFNRPFRVSLVGLQDFRGFGGPGQLTVTAWPVRATQACVGKTDKGAQYDDYKSNGCGDQRQAVQARLHYLLSGFD